jgi:hypothetical protein
VSQDLKHTVANFIFMASILLTIAPSVWVSAFLNGVDAKKLGSGPYYHLIQYHLYFIPFMCIGLLAASHYIFNQKLRQTMIREAKLRIQNIFPCELVPIEN